MKQVQGKRERGVKMRSSLLARTPERVELLLIKMGKHWEEQLFSASYFLHTHCPGLFGLTLYLGRHREEPQSRSKDVRTQAMYQMMDQGFVGLIFSCFIEDKNTKTGRVLYTCFQSIQAQKSSEYERIEIPIHIVPHVTIGKVCLESAVELPKILCQEEQDAYRRIHSLTHLDSVTKIHNGSGFPLAYGSRDVHDGLRIVFTKNLCSQMSAVSGPLLQWLEDRLEQNQQHLQELQQEKEELMRELSSLE
ncbi:lys-63-specific deubiquitinase BRCC36 isoform X3 [Pteropus medius]|uniref:lys-63-specific deubiquitinase BRCC36 isoform X3 n=2 Tax=Pteropus vampyrus TaxID=132908 RepID=UPI00196B5B56|nr:lys-63-specific deubiquitinase BRCC36 isoform X3 [Pteropus giganteus]